MSVQKLLSEQRAGSDFSSVYLILVFAIAALLLIFLIKPMFQKSATLVKTTSGSQTVSGGK